MGLFAFWRKRNRQEAAAEPEQPEEASSLSRYSGMRVEVTTLDGRLLFVAKLLGLRGNQGELHQYSESAAPQIAEPLRVKIRGYHDHEKKAVTLEGLVSPGTQHIWRAEELALSGTGSDRAFFRLATNLDASMTTFGGIGAGERACKLLNISIGGACVCTDYACQEGDKFLLKVRLLEDREPSVMFCQILRIIGKEKEQYTYGCRFLELSEADQTRITQNIFAAQRQKRGGR